jgi:hypothetical protein
MLKTKAKPTLRGRVAAVCGAPVTAKCPTNILPDTSTQFEAKAQVKRRIQVATQRSALKGLNSLSHVFCDSEAKFKKKAEQTFCSCQTLIRGELAIFCGSSKIGESAEPLEKAFRILKLTVPVKLVGSASEIFGRGSQIGWWRLTRDKASSIPYLR